MKGLVLAAGLLLSTAAAKPVSRPLALVFWEEGFPAVDAPAPERRALEAALDGFDPAFRGAGAFGKLLDDWEPALVVLPYGSAFPEEAWGPFLRYLGRGGSFVQVGGSPFAAPVGGRPGARTTPSPNPALARRLGFVRAEPAETDRVVRWEAASLPLSLEGFSPRRVPALDVILCGAASRPEESGSDGPREGILTPLVVGRSSDGTPRAAPVFRVDRIGGEFAGGRWLFALGDGTLPVPALKALFSSAAEGGSALSVRPALAVFRPGEAPRATVRIEGPRARPRHRSREGEAPRAPVKVELFDPKGKRIASAEARLARDDGGWSGSIELPALGERAPRGLYTLRAGSASSGFLVQEAKDVAGGAPLGAEGTFLSREGRPFAAAGMTFMDPFSQRRLLLDPDPLAWEAELAEMQKAGVNLVRTGIWTGWRLHAPEAGRPTEGVLRAAEALVLTARRHGMPVILTLFAFLPETWGGGHPYLAPGALAAQRAFASALAKRLAGARDVAWDLVNEPSFADPASLWSTRPAGGEIEREAFARWMETSPWFGPEDRGEERVRARWRLAPGEPISLPSAEDFEDRYLSGGRHPFRALDFRLFAQDAFREWTVAMAAALGSVGSSGPVTVGTDEGGTGEMPNPRYFGDATAFTQVHSWWNGADLSWDTLAVRLPGRPALVGETGLMSYERADATPWMDAAARGEVLARKLALSLGAGGAGAVLWAFRTNPLMPSANEAGIGLFRADGTARPELDTFRAFARFAARVSPHLGAPEPEEAVVVAPVSRLGPGGDRVADASRRSVRLLEGELRIPARIAGEGRLEKELAGARLVLVPSPGALTRPGWEALLAAAREGATVLVTGPFDADPWGRATGRSEGLGLPPGDRVLSPAEPVVLPSGEPAAIRFRGALLERARAAAAPRSASAGAASRLHSVPMGKGRLLLFPLPVELAEESPFATALYRFAAEAAGVSAPVTVQPEDPALFVRAVVTKETFLLAVDGPPGAALLVPRGSDRPVPLERKGNEAVLILVRRSDGAVLARSDGP